MSAETFQPLVEWMAQNPIWLLFGIFAVSMFESLAVVGAIVPGVLSLFLVGIAAGKIGLGLGPSMAAGILGAVAGDGVSFYLGHWFKDSLRQTWPFSRYPNAMQNGEQFFTRHGGKSIVIGRFFGPLRAMVPLIAGMMNMNPWHFLAFNIVSAIAWAPFYILPGYLTGAALNTTLPEDFYLIMGIAAAVATIAMLLFHVCGQRLQPGSTLYDFIELKQEKSAFFRALWEYLTHHHTTPEFPLASLMLFIVSLLGFIVWSWLTLLNPDMVHLNQTLLAFAGELRNEVFDPVLVSLTMLGDEAFLYLSFTILIITMALLHRPLFALHLVVAGLATAAITHGLKVMFAIPRPDFLLTLPDTLSYPSGHSSGITVFYGLVASFIAQNVLPGARWKIYLSFGIPIILVAFSRVLLGAHWLTDIIGGVLLGLALCGLTRTIYSRWAETRAPALSGQRNVLIMVGGVTVWVIAAIGYQSYLFDDEIQRYGIKPSVVSVDPKSSAGDTPDRSSPAGSVSAQSPAAVIPSDANPPDGSPQNQSPASALPPSDAPPAP